MISALLIFLFFYVLSGLLAGFSGTNMTGNVKRLIDTLSNFYKATDWVPVLEVTGTTLGSIILLGSVIGLIYFVYTFPMQFQNSVVGVLNTPLHISNFLLGTHFSGMLHVWTTLSDFTC